MTTHQPSSESQSDSPRSEHPAELPETLPANALHQSCTPESQNKMQHYSPETNELLEWISDGFYAVDQHWRFTFMNQRFESLLNVKREDCLGRTLWECFPYLQQTECYERYHLAVQQNVTVTIERFDAPHHRWLEATARPTPSGLSVILRDVTGQKLNEAALHQANERFQLAAKTDAIYDWDLVSGYLFWGDALQDLFGYSSEEFQINQWEEALHPDEKQELIIDLQRTLATPSATVWKREYRLRKKSGEFCFAYERGYILRDDNGKATRMVGLMQNITQRKQLEGELERQRKETAAAVLQAQERERAEIGRELHDNVNQILTSAKLYQELVLSGIGDREELVRKTMALIQQAIDENRRLSKQLSATTLGKICLVDTVNELVDTFAAAQKFVLDLQIEGVDGFQASDELHLALYRILQEHLTNVSRHAVASNVQVVLRRESDSLELVVTDNGVGFEPTQKRTGVGIRNMKVRAESLHGTLTIDSAPGNGCTLTVRLPLTQ